VTWARGQLPTPHGPLKVDWVSGRKTFALTVDAPRGTSGTVSLPGKGKTALVLFDGRPTSDTTLHVRNGHHVITITPGPGR
jgi:alpha-L-rhamnosidase-like protein